MKKLIVLLLATATGLQLAAQDQVNSYIQEAQNFLAQKQYRQAQLSLQDAVNEINTLLAKQVAEALPAEINGLKAEGEGEVNTAGMGMIGGGMQITKRYQNATKSENTAEVQIMANSPLLATMSMYLSNPSMMGADYKSARVGTMRAILKTEMQDNDSGTGKIRSSELQIPMGQTLVTIHLMGFATEQDELAFANKLGFDKIKTALGE